MRITFEAVSVDEILSQVQQFMNVFGGKATVTSIHSSSPAAAGSVSGDTGSLTRGVGDEVLCQPADEGSKTSEAPKKRGRKPRAEVAQNTETVKESTETVESPAAPAAVASASVNVTAAVTAPTKAEITALFNQVVAAEGLGMVVARDILSHFGANRIADLMDAQYVDVVTVLNRALKEKKFSPEMIPEGDGAA